MRDRNRKKGYIGLIALIIVVAVIITWSGYLWYKQWNLDLNVDINPQEENAQGETQENKAINEQLNDLRQDVNELQNKKNQEIYDATEQAD